MKYVIVCLASLLSAYSSGVGDSQTDEQTKPTKVALDGDSVLNGRAGGKTIRVVVSTYKIDIGSPSQAAPRVRKTNCTYSCYPCSQVSNLRIWVNGKELLFSRSVFADLADVGNMSLTDAGGGSVLLLAGGDGSEAFTVKIYFDAVRVKKREVYWEEGGRLDETTTYMPPAVLD